MEKQKPEKLARVKSGIPGLDLLLGGGLVEKSLVLLRGESGSGKTILALQFLHSGAKNGEPGIYISFSEDKDALYRQAVQFGWDFEKLEKGGKFAFLRFEPHEVANVVEEGGGTIRDLVESLRAKRLVIDSITPYTLVFDSAYRENEALLELFRMLRNWKCTSLLVSEARATLSGGEKEERAMILADAALNLHYSREGREGREGARRARSIEVLKIRGSAHSEKLASFRIGARGIEVQQ